jgi:hypothetical protein
LQNNESANAHLNICTNWLYPAIRVQRNRREAHQAKHKKKIVFLHKNHAKSNQQEHLPGKAFGRNQSINPGDQKDRRYQFISNNSLQYPMGGKTSSQLLGEKLPRLNPGSDRQQFESKVS